MPFLSRKKSYILLLIFSLTFICRSFVSFFHVNLLFICRRQTDGGFPASESKNAKCNSKMRFSYPATNYPSFATTFSIFLLTIFDCIFAHISAPIEKYFVHFLAPHPHHTLQRHHPNPSPFYTAPHYQTDCLVYGDISCENPHTSVLSLK